jgi:ATP-dependent RNA helicase SUPV3L1/SUV3
MNRRVARLNHIEGDIDTLMNRIAFVRTWTYISHHSEWLRDGARWRERTRAIEDRLSDALHQRLVQRFVARRRVQVQAPEPDDRHPFSKLRALIEPADSRQRWIDDLTDAEHERFSVDARGVIAYRDGDRATEVARLTRGGDLLHPGLALLLDSLGAAGRARIERRLTAYIRDLVTHTVAPLRDPLADELSPAGRGLVYQLEQQLGIIARRQAAPQLAGLRDRDRRLLGRLGVRPGRRHIFLPELLSPAAVARRLALVAPRWPIGVGHLAPRPGATSWAVDARVDAGLYLSLGFPVFGPLASRADIVERVDAALAELARGGAVFAPTPQLCGWLGCKREDIGDVIVAFDYLATADGGFMRAPRRRQRRPRK